MHTLKVFLFGKFHLQIGEQTLNSFDARKGQELFCYLLLHKDRSHAREVLADILWEDSSTAQSKSYLRKALWQLQVILDKFVEPDKSDVLLVEPNYIQINPEGILWLDISICERAFNLVQGIRGQDLNDQQAEMVREAVDLYCGDLLEGWYQSWCLYERERFQYIYLALLDKLMNYCEARHQYEAGIAYGMAALRYDPAREHTHRRLMRLKYLTGDRTAALRQYKQCLATLDEELGVAPTQQTLALVERIQADTLDSLNPVPSEMPAAKIPSLPTILSHLENIYDCLEHTQYQIKADIQTIKQMINNHG